MRPALVAVVFALVGIGAGCASNGSNPGGAVVEGTVVERTTTTTIPPAPPLIPTSTVPVELVPPVEISRNQTTADTKVATWSWNGQRYDIGTITDIHPVGDAWVITFQRASVTDAHGTRSGRQLDVEPLILGAGASEVRPVGHANLAFAVAADVTVVQLNTAWSCGQDPDWLDVPMSQVANNGVGGDTIDTLTFGPDGQVTAIRLSRGC